MQPRPARLQYALLAVVALLGLTHFYLGAVKDFDNLDHGQLRARHPFGADLGNTVQYSTPEAKAAGLQEGDTILTLDGHPYTSSVILTELVRSAKPQEPLTVTFTRAGHPVPQATVIRLAAERAKRPPAWAWVVQSSFLILPFFCLLTGLYVVFARPRSTYAWLILGILGFFDALFIPAPQLYGPLMPIALFWNTIAQTAMPPCLMLFGIYFPERSPIDIRIPWLKWILIVAILALLPLDIFASYGHAYNFAAVAWLAAYYWPINTFENIVAALSITYFFMALGPKLRSATADARRRLRVLYAGSSVGLTPFFVLLIISLARKRDIGYNMPQWILLSAFSTLLLFPLSLAYVVVVQRAMDLRILLRQGTKYFFARQSIWIIRFSLTAWLISSVLRFFNDPTHHRAVDLVLILGIMGMFFAFRYRLSATLQSEIDKRFFREAYSAEQVLSELSDEARNFIETAPLLDTITQRIGATLHVQRIAVFLRTGDTFRLELATGPALLPASFESKVKVLSLAAASTTITTLTESKAPANVYRDDPSSWLVNASDAERAALNDLSTELLVPLPGRNRLIGVMALGPKLSEEPYSRSDRQLLQTVASQTGLALENAELLENLATEIAQRERVARDLEIAREVQERLFPQSYPQIAGVDIAGFCRPAQAVGGDYYDVFALPGSDPNAAPGESRLGIAIGDISGKGIPAALLMASLRASLRSVASLQPDAENPDLASLIRHVNRMVYESSSANRYATFFYAEFDPRTRLLTYVNAGHNSPSILRTREAIALHPTGTVVGLLSDSEYSQATLALHAGDVFLGFTDGVSEAMTGDDEEWGEDRMIACAQGKLAEPGCTTTAGQLLTCILNEADKFAAGAAQHDDMTLLVCRFD